MTEEVVSVEFSYVELWKVIESLPEDCSSIREKLKAARGAFERNPKVYGKGLAIRVKGNA